MAWRLNDGVVGGELDNTRPGMVRGRLELSDGRVIQLDLTGDLPEPLARGHWRFTQERTRGDSTPVANLLDRFSLHQSGEIGTVYREPRKVPRCSIEEFLELHDRGQSPPVDVLPVLYLEWYGPNGRVVAELCDAALASVGLREVGQPTRRSPAAPQRDDTPPSRAIERILDAAQATVVTPVKRSWDEVLPGIDAQTKQMFEQWDEMFSGEHDVPLLSMFKPPLELRNADELSGDEADQVLDELLDRLEEIHVSFDICEHFSSQDAYRLIVEHVLPFEGIYPKIAETGHYATYSTSDHCRECLGEEPLDEAS